MQLVKVNEVEVKPIKPVSEPDLRPVMGADLFPECNAAIFICAPRGSGKTSVLGKILKECTGKKTRIVSFCANLDKDKAWIALQKRFGDQMEGYTSIIDPEEKIDMLEILNDEIKYKAAEEKERLLNPEKVKVDVDHDRERLKEAMFGQEATQEEEEEKKEKKRCPEYIVVFDDLSDEIKNNRQVAKLLKNGRHFCKIIISSQYLKDLKPESRSQIDYFILFGGLPKETKLTVYRNANMPVSFERFCEIYDHATKDKYNFLYIDTRNAVFRKNFNQQYRI